MDSLLIYFGVNLCLTLAIGVAYRHLILILFSVKNRLLLFIAGLFAALPITIGVLLRNFKAVIKKLKKRG